MNRNDAEKVGTAPTHGCISWNCLRFTPGTMSMNSVIEFLSPNVSGRRTGSS
jgi:hypothetical protein